jgi:hypothetical protein
MDSFDFVQDRGQWRALVKTAMNTLVLQNVGKFLSDCTTGDLSGSAEPL